MIPAHFICWNHFYSFLSVQTRVPETRRSGPPESRRTLSRRNHFSSFLPGETGAQGARRSGSPGCTALFFEGTSFPHSFRVGPQPWKPRDWDRRGCTALFFKGTSFPHSFRLGPQPWKPGDWARRDALHFFSREPIFLIPSGWDRSPGSQEIGIAWMHCTFLQGNHLPSFPLFRGRRWPPDFLPQFFL